MMKPCAVCGTLDKPPTGLFCRACRTARQKARHKVVDAPCKECGANVRMVGPEVAKYREGSVYCSVACKEQHVSKRASAAMARTNRLYASRRMTEKNPMASPETRAKVSATLRAIGHRPPVQGGNGRGPTVPQRMLADALGWEMEVPIKTGARPPVLKADIAHPGMKIAVEVDGLSHNCVRVRAADERKTAILNGLGWTVLRFANATVLHNMEECLSTILKCVEATRTQQTGT